MQHPEKKKGFLSRQDDQNDSVFLIRLKDEELLEASDDSAFLQSLRFCCARVNGVYPLLALAEAYITKEDSTPRVRKVGRRVFAYSLYSVEGKPRGLPVTSLDMSLDM